MTLKPTGVQYPIAAGRYAAVITEVGAICRSLTVDGTEVLWTFGEDEAPRGSMGKQLLPWPNRVRDGRYTFAGQELQLDVTEVPRNTALHGLNSGRAWELLEHSENRVVQRHTLYPENGWTGILTAEITHELSEDGLRVTVRALNDGATALPYGYGVHPYFQFSNTDDVVLSLPFEQELIVDPERLLPISVDTVTAEHDFREPRPLGSTEFDTALTGPTEADWTVSLTGDGRTVEVWADATCPWVQVYTTRPDRNAVAVEPMTCGPDCYNEGPTHDSLVTLQPGEQHVATWGVRVS